MSDSSGIFIPDPSAVEAVSPAEIPALLTKVSAFLTALGAKMAAAPAESNSRGEPVAGPDQLLAIGETAERLGVTKDWLYRHAGKLPFTRRVGRKTLRFSERDLEKYMAAKR